MEWALSKVIDTHKYLYPCEHRKRANVEVVDDKYYDLSLYVNDYITAFVEGFGIPHADIVIPDHYTKWSEFVNYVENLNETYKNEITKLPKYQSIKQDLDMLTIMQNEYNAEYKTCYEIKSADDCEYKLSRKYLSILYHSQIYSDTRTESVYSSDRFDRTKFSILK